MAAIPNIAYFPAGSISIDTDEYTAAVDSATLTPTVPMTVIGDIGGGVTPVAGVPTWALGLSVVQDVETINSLSLYLIEHVGEIKPITYKPKGSGKTFTVSALIMPAAIGGAAGSVAKSTVTLPCANQPTIA